MNWTRLDNEGEAKACEIPGVGCFVKFYVGIVSVCFVPNVRLELDGKGCGTLQPFASTQLTFSTTEGTSTMHWIGDAGDKLDAKLAKLERKRWRADKVAKNKPVNKIVNKRVGKKVTATRVRG